MILRRPAVADDASISNDSDAPEAFGFFSRGTPLRWRLQVLTAGMVSLAIAAITTLTYVAVSQVLYEIADRNLEERAVSLMERSSEPQRLVNLSEEIDNFKSHNPRMRVSISLPGWAFSQGDSIPLDRDVPRADPDGDAGSSIVTSVSSIGNERVLVAHDEFDTVIVLAQDMTEVQRTLSMFTATLFLISLIGILVAVTTGIAVASAGLWPLAKLQRAVDHVAKTDELEPIEVVGDDDIAQLTRSFNTMLASLRESREQQTQLVADAGHELKTPLTSMRTNIELLLMAKREDAVNKISEQDSLDLKNDVIAQMEEMSTLIGDLVDLTRDSTPQLVTESAQLDEIVASLLERVQRRRPDVTFDVGLIPWQITGNPFALSRAMLNLVDNAAKWSPEGGIVRISMMMKSATQIHITISDAGPGIKEEDRDRVFERFYRSTEARSTPGSGLGLAIAKQAITQHGGEVSITESEFSGAKLVVDLPGQKGS